LLGTRSDLSICAGLHRLGIIVNVGSSCLDGDGRVWKRSEHKSGLSGYKLETVSMRLFAKFLADDSGATAIEYGLIAAGISLAIIAVINGLGTNLNDKFTSINRSLKWG
jgi:pilus assembly protein Flp/PilA